MSDVRNVYITSEVAEKVKLTPSYLIKLSKDMNFTDDEFREAGKRNYLFNQSAVDKLLKRLSK